MPGASIGRQIHSPRATADRLMMPRGHDVDRLPRVCELASTRLKNPDDLRLGALGVDPIKPRQRSSNACCGPRDFLRLDAQQLGLFAEQRVQLPHKRSSLCAFSASVGVSRRMQLAFSCSRPCRLLPRPPIANRFRLSRSPLRRPAVRHSFAPIVCSAQFEFPARGRRCSPAGGRSDLTLSERSRLQTRLALGRQLVGDLDALARFTSWRSPTER